MTKQNSLKPTIIILVIVVVLIILSIIYNLTKNSNSPNLVELTDPTQIQTRSIRSDNNGNHLVASGDSYRITYQSEYNTYLVTILSSPFETHRQEAEQQLLQFLQVPPEVACQLTINISTPRFANPDIAGQIFHPSFCQ